MALMKEGSVSAYEVLLEDFCALPPFKKLPPTVFDICGFPRWENVISNALEFFLDSSREHGLKDLFLRALLDAAGAKEVDSRPPFEVVREVATDSEKRIDLMLRHDAACIVIENKIDAPESNPLKEYREFAQENADGGRVVLIFLAMRPPRDLAAGFVAVSYRQYIRHLNKLFGQYVAYANPAYLGLASDLIRNLSGSTSMISQNFREFVSTHSGEVQGFESELKAFRKELRSKVKEVNQEVIDRLERKYGLDQGAWRSAEFRDAAVSTFRLLRDGEYWFSVHAAVDSAGWSFYIGERPEHQKSIDDIEAFCLQRDLPGRLAGDKVWYVLDERRDYGTMAKEIAERVVEIIEAVQKPSSD